MSFTQRDATLRSENARQLTPGVNYNPTFDSHARSSGIVHEFPDAEKEISTVRSFHSNYYNKGDRYAETGEHNNGDRRFSTYSHKASPKPNYTDMSSREIGHASMQATRMDKAALEVDLTAPQPFQSRTSTRVVKPDLPLKNKGGDTPLVSQVLSK